MYFMVLYCSVTNMDIVCFEENYVPLSHRDSRTMQPVWSGEWTRGMLNNDIMNKK